MTTPEKQTVLLCITKADWGGAQRYIYDLATNLPPEEYNVFVSIGGEGELKDRLVAAGITVLTIDSLQRDISVRKEWSSTKQLLQHIRAVKPDIIHSTGSKAGALGTLLGRLLGVERVLFTACAWAFNEDRPVWQRFVIKVIHWGTVLLSHQSIALSHGLKSQMDWPWAEKKITVVHLGRTLPAIKTKHEARQTLRDTHQKLVKDSTLTADLGEQWIGSIAELHHIKRINVAIDAFATLSKTHPKLRYLIIHDGDEREKLERLVHEYGLSDRIHFMGKIPDAAELIPAFDVFILPSKSEAFGYVLVEAGLAGVPVVASNVGGIPDVVIDGETGLLVPPDNPTALANAIDTYLTDEPARQNFAVAHHRRSQSFTISAMIEKTIALYNR